MPAQRGAFELVGRVRFELTLVSGYEPDSDTITDCRPIERAVRQGLTPL